MGKDKPENFVSEYEEEEGKTSSLLAQLTRGGFYPKLSFFKIARDRPRDNLRQGIFLKNS
jgi:hypothetical protein